jgi:hypothetical protein
LSLAGGTHFTGADSGGRLSPLSTSVVDGAALALAHPFTVAGWAAALACGTTLTTAHFGHLPLRPAVASSTTKSSAQPLQGNSIAMNFCPA